MIASVQPSRLPASSSSARRRVAGALRLRALRRGLPTEDIGRGYGIAMCESSRPKLPPEWPPDGLVHAAAHTPASRGRLLRRSLLAATGLRAAQNNAPTGFLRTHRGHATGLIAERPHKS